MEQKNSCFVFFIVRLINQCVPPFFMWRQINSSTYVRAEPESSTILKGKKESPLDTILSQLYPTPILNLSQHYRILPSHLFSVFEVSISQGVCLPKFSMHDFSPCPLLLQQYIAPSCILLSWQQKKLSFVIHKVVCVFERVGRFMMSRWSDADIWEVDRCLCAN